VTGQPDPRSDEPFNVDAAAGPGPVQPPPGRGFSLGGGRLGRTWIAIWGMLCDAADWTNGRMASPQPPKRRAYPARIVVLIVAGAALGAMLCCGGMLLVGTLPSSLYP